MIAAPLPAASRRCQCGRMAVGEASKRSAPGWYGRVYWRAPLCAEHAADFLDAQEWIDAFLARLRPEEL